MLRKKGMQVWRKCATYNEEAGQTDTEEKGIHMLRKGQSNAEQAVKQML
jgi:hypothetical protein